MGSQHYSFNRICINIRSSSLSDPWNACVQMFSVQFQLVSFKFAFSVSVKLKFVKVSVDLICIELLSCLYLVVFRTLCVTVPVLVMSLNDRNQLNYIIIRFYCFIWGTASAKPELFCNYYGICCVCVTKVSAKLFFFCLFCHCQT